MLITLTQAVNVHTYTMHRDKYFLKIEKCLSQSLHLLHLFIDLYFIIDMKFHYRQAIPFHVMEKEF